MDSRQVYGFLDFELDAANRRLSQGGRAVALSETGFRLLLAFVRRPGEVFSRDALIDAVWDGRFVQDATLYKQVQRLRDALGDVGEDKRIVRTVHGTGFVFLPAVHSVASSDAAVAPSATRRVGLWAVTAALLVSLPLLGWLFWSPEEAAVSEVAAADPWVLSIVPGRPVAADAEWMAYGGMHYLYERWQHAWPQVRLKRLSREALNQTSAQAQAIELVDQRQVAAVITFDLTDVQGLFAAEAQIRSQGGVIAAERFEADSIQQLLDTLHRWSMQVLEITPVQDGREPSMSADRFAVENYIRGMAAQFTGDAARAIGFFQQATDADPQFWKAWYELAIALRKQGDIKKALSILDTLAQAPVPDALLSNIDNARVLALWRLGEHARALELADRAIGAAAARGEPQKKAILLTNKAIIAFEMNELTAAEDALREAIEIKSQAGDPAALASAHNMRSHIALARNDLPTAIDSVHRAMELYQLKGDRRYVATNRSLLGHILIRQGQLDKARNQVDEALSTQRALGDVSGAANSLFKHVEIALWQGRLNDADTALQGADDLLSGTGNLALENTALAWRVRLLQARGAVAEAESRLEQLAQRRKKPAMQLQWQLLMQAQHLAMGRTEAGLQLWRTWRADDAAENNPLLHHWQALWDAASGHFDAASAAHQRALQLAEAQYNAPVLWLVGNAWIEFLLRHRPEDVEEALTRLQRHNPPAHPFLRHKAQHLAAEGDHFQAAAALQELKNRAHDYWRVEDQLMLEQQQKALQPDP